MGQICRHDGRDAKPIIHKNMERLVVLKSEVRSSLTKMKVKKQQEQIGL